MRHKFIKRSAEKFVSRIDPEAFSASGSRVVFPVACHLRFKASATKRDEPEEISIMIPRYLRRGVSLKTINFVMVVFYVGINKINHTNFFR